MKTEEELTELFRQFGAPEPESWAASQAQEGIPQLARFLFLKQAWGEVVKPGDTDWIAEGLTVPLDGPGGGIGPALDALLSKGVDRHALTEVVRVMQWQLLFRLCYQLQGDCDGISAHANWRLYEVDSSGKPLTVIGSLHESVLETDPSGTEMGASYLR